jgi:hypothetical protein
MTPYNLVFFETPINFYKTTRRHIPEHLLFIGLILSICMQEGFGAHPPACPSFVARGVSTVPAGKDDGSVKMITHRRAFQSLYDPYIP